MLIILGIDYLKSHFTHNQRYIIVAVLSMFLPFYICGSILAFLTIRLLIKGEIQQAYRTVHNSQYILYFCILIFLVSLFYQNYLGALCSIFILILLSFILYYRMHITKELFEFITQCIIILSVLAALYGLIEYMGILNSLDINEFEVIIFNSPKRRVNSVFFNANYYAMMIEFFVCLAFYKILQIKNIKKEYKMLIYYTLTIALNLFLLVLTACRTAWFALAGGIIIMLIFDQHFKACLTLLGGCLISGIYFLFNPSRFPRVDTIIDYFFTRMDIWQVAIKNIISHPLFGEGPMTYYHVYSLYDGHPTEHAHSIYLDPLLCFGIVGICTIFPYVFDNIKRLYFLWKSKQDRTLVALILGFIIMIFIHGILDYTIFFVQTGFLFLMVASSFDIYKNQMKKYISKRQHNK